MIYETPYFLVDLQEVRNLHKKWTTHLPTVTPYYAIKCNSNPDILREMEKLNMNFDCASKEEMNQVQKITQDPHRIIFANPCKIPSHIHYAKEKQVKRMIFDCSEELYKIKEIFSEAELFLRIAVDDSGSKCQFNKKFGCPIEEVESLLLLSLRENISIVGFSFHLGSGCQYPIKYYEALIQCKRAVQLAKGLNISIKYIDIGGGMTKNLFPEMADHIKRGIQEFSTTDNIKFIAEPGRYFAETTHTLVLQIIGKKMRETPIYYVNDGTYGSFNCIKNDDIVPKLFSFEKGEKKKSIVFGPTCDSIDIITEEAMLPDLNIGDYLFVENFGAYTISASCQFNGFELPKSISY
jgi:ornithine decarboxylase